MSPLLLFYTTLWRPQITILSLTSLGNRAEFLCLEHWWLFISSSSLILFLWELAPESVLVGFPLIEASFLRQIRSSSKVNVSRPVFKAQKGISKVLEPWCQLFLVGPFPINGMDPSLQWVNLESFWLSFFLLHILHSDRGPSVPSPGLGTSLVSFTSFCLPRT